MLVAHTDNKTGEIRCSQEVMASKIGKDRSNFNRTLKQVPQWIEVVTQTRRAAQLNWVRLSEKQPEVVTETIEVVPQTIEVVTDTTSGGHTDNLSTHTTVESTKTLQLSTETSQEKNNVDSQDSQGSRPGLQTEVKEDNTPPQTATPNSAGEEYIKFLEEEYLFAGFLNLEPSSWTTNQYKHLVNSIEITRDEHGVGRKVVHPARVLKYPVGSKSPDRMYKGLNGQQVGSQPLFTSKDDIDKELVRIKPKIIEYLLKKIEEEVEVRTKATERTNI